MNNHDAIKALIDLSIKYRGTILNNCIVIEKDVEDYIIKHFVQDEHKQIEFLQVVISRMTFDDKIAVFELILKRKYEFVFDKKFSKLFSELRYIKDKRNTFAHYLVFTMYEKDEVIPKEFSLVNFRNSTNIKTFSKGDFMLFGKRFNKCREAIKEVAQIM